jgi:hypothetical protein
MTKKIAEKIVKGITDKIECNTADIDDWAEFWGFTREEYEEFLNMAIEAIEQEPQTFEWCTDCREYDQKKHCCHRWSKVIRNAVEEMKQQPCEDCINRQAALNIYDDYNVAVENGELEAYRKHRKRLLKLPPVTPKQKVGHWIKPKGEVKPFGDDTIQCDMCGFFTDVDCNYNFCPNCGARMIEPQESENKK